MNAARQLPGGARAKPPAISQVFANSSIFITQRDLRDAGVVGVYSNVKAQRDHTGQGVYSQGGTTPD